MLLGDLHKGLLPNITEKYFQIELKEEVDLLKKCLRCMPHTELSEIKNNSSI